MVKISRIDIDKNGLTKFFSPNEVRIMELIWKRGRITSSGMQKELNDLSLPCIAGTLDRLVKYGIVGREIDESEKKIKYIYYPKNTREEVAVQISERVIERLIDAFGDLVIDSLGKYKSKSDDKSDGE